MRILFIDKAKEKLIYNFLHAAGHDHIYACASSNRYTERKYNLSTVANFYYHIAKYLISKEKALELKYTLLGDVSFIEKIGFDKQ